MLFTPTPFKIVKKEKQTQDISLFRLQRSGDKNKKSGLCYDPGEFFQVSVPGVGEAPFSVCACSKDFIEFNIRGVGEVTDALIKLDVGDNMWLRGPYGNFYPMKEFVGKSLVIIGGGTGVAPLRGVLKYVVFTNVNYCIIILLEYVMHCFNMTLVMGKLIFIKHLTK